MSTAVVSIPANNNAPIPTSITAASSWRCAGCGQLVDETKSVAYVVRGGRAKVWHPACRRAR